MIPRLFYVFLLPTIFLLSGFLAAFLLANNPRSDMQSYILGAEDYGSTYFEPLALVYFESIRVISSILNIPWLLGSISSFTFIYFLYFKAKCNTHLCMFWLLTLGLVLPLINIRYSVVFLIAIFFPANIVKYLAFFAHWNLIILLVPKSKKQIVRFFLFSLPLILILLYYHILDFVFLKITHYLSLEERVYGVAIFVELFLVAFAFRRIYLELGENSSLFFMLIIFALLGGIAGFPVVAGRILTLALLVTVIDLYKSKKVKLDLFSVSLLYLVSFYEIFRVISMIGLI